MSIQAKLNENSMDYAPEIKKVIASASAFEANQMEQKTLREMMNSPKPIVDMNDKEIEQFQTDLLGVFRHYNWI